MMAGQTPKPTPPAGFGRETFHAFARAATREDLMAAMRAQAEATAASAASATRG